MAQMLQSARLNAEILQALSLLAEQTRPFFQTIEYLGFVEKACNQSAYLPYRTVPYAEFYLECGGSYDEYFSRIAGYYESHQENILQDIDSQLAILDICEEPKATLQEAIQAHRCGLYRLTCRGLLPDIERVIIENWLGQREIRKLSENLIGKAVENRRFEEITLDNWFDLKLHDRLMNHFYRNGKHLKEIRKEALPNRHAALHGWIPYSSRENSLNTIIFAEYIFRLGALLKDDKN